jgi:hypothetical protein
MDLPSYVPSPEEGLELLAPLVPHLQPALDNAFFKATAYIEAEELSCDTTTFLTFVRAHAKTYLVKQQVNGVKFTDWALSGIEFQLNGAIFRCWKGTEKELPLPGTSEGRKKFLNQQYSLPFASATSEKLNNFVILYSVGPMNKIVLWLACPKQYHEEERIADVWWWVKIEEPATTLSVPTSIGKPPSGDLDEIRPVAIPKTGDQSD